MAYIGKAPFGNAVRTRFFYTASGSETSLSGADSNGKTLSFTDGNYVDVYLNGVLLITGTDYNTSTENTIAGLSALSAGDNVEIVVYETFSVFNSTFTGGLTVNEGLTVDGSSVLSVDSSSIATILQLRNDDKTDDNGLRLDFNSLDTSNNDNVFGRIEVEIKNHATEKSNMNFSIRNDSGSLTELFVLDKDEKIIMNGNVGIGTTNPQFHLQTVNGGLDSRGSGAGIAIRNNLYYSSGDKYLTASGAASTQYFDGSGNIIFYNTGTASSGAGNTVSLSERMRITSGGNVGIGTASPVATLQIKTQTNGNAAFQNSTSVSGGVKINAFNDAANASVPFELDGSTLQFNIAATEKMRIDSSGNVGIGITNPTEKFTVVNSSSGIVGRFTNNINQTLDLGVISGSGSAGGVSLNNANSGYLSFQSGGSEKMRIDSSGSLLVGKTEDGTSNAGHVFFGSGAAYHIRSGGFTNYFNRLSSNGEILRFAKDGTSIGKLGTFNGYPFYGHATQSGAGLLYVSTTIRPFDCNTESQSDNEFDLGTGSTRFDDIYATNGTIQTSDQNEKQQIASLTSAEITAAKAISKLFKTFKWNDSVTENGDNARTHTGVIAQDVQQAMTDAGLDAGDYAFFISATWWETQTEVPAVEADEENGIEAADAYTRTDTYDTAEEAPEGATERTRLGIRYPELLAFVGAANEQRLVNIETRLTALEAN